MRKVRGGTTKDTYLPIFKRDKKEKEKLNSSGGSEGSGEELSEGSDSENFVAKDCHCTLNSQTFRVGSKYSTGGFHTELLFIENINSDTNNGAQNCHSIKRRKRKPSLMYGSIENLGRKYYNSLKPQDGDDKESEGCENEERKGNSTERGKDKKRSLSIIERSLSATVLPSMYMTSYSSMDISTSRRNMTPTELKKLEDECLLTFDSKTESL